MKSFFCLIVALTILLVIACPTKDNDYLSTVIDTTTTIDNTTITTINNSTTTTSIDNSTTTTDSTTTTSINNSTTTTDSTTTTSIDNSTTTTDSTTTTSTNNSTTTTDSTTTTSIDNSTTTTDSTTTTSINNSTTTTDSTTTTTDIGEIQLATPTGLTLGAVTFNSVSFSWNSVNKATKYEIYQFLGGGYSKVTNNIDITENTATITGLNENTTYRYSVKAIGNGNYLDSELSNYIEVKTKIQLNTPRNLKEDSATVNSVTFSWNSVDNAVSYEVYQSTTSGGTGTYIKVMDNITETTATINGLTVDTTYYYKVRAIGNVNYSNSELSNLIIVTISKIQLATPTGLSLGSVTANSVSFLWTSVNNASGYEVYQFLDGDYSKITANITGTSTIITGLTGGTTYYFKVRAIGSEAYLSSQLSDYIEAKTKIQLDTPTNLILGTVTFNSVTFSWNSVDNTTRYEVHQSTTSGGTGTYTKIMDNITGTSATITGLNSYTTYYFKVIAIGSGDYMNSELSDYIEAKTTTIIINKIATGGYYNLGLDSTGKVWGWGDNGNGQLGDNSTTNRSYPVQIRNSSGNIITTTFIAVSAGQHHSLAIDSTGKVWAWGNNSQGQLGDDSTTDRSYPVQIRDSSGNIITTTFTTVAAGFFYSLAIDSTGKVWTWGYNSGGQLGDNSTTNKSYPVQIRNSSGNIITTTFIAVSAGQHHSLAIDSTGKVWTWGGNNVGQLGDNSTTNKSYPVQIRNSSGNIITTTFTSVAAGYYNSLAIDSTGKVWAWGLNYNGQLGDNSTTNKSYPVQIRDNSGNIITTTFTAVSAGNSHSLAIDSTGKVWAWGNNYTGQLGDNSTTNKNYPVQIKNIIGNIITTTFIAVAAGSTHSLAIDSTGKVWAWGRNNSGQLGDNSTTDKSYPVQVLFPFFP